MPIMAMWLCRFEIIDLDVVFSFNDVSLFPLSFERCLEELSGLIPKGEIVCLPIKGILGLWLVVGRNRLSHDDFWSVLIDWFNRVMINA